MKDINKTLDLIFEELESIGDTLSLLQETQSTKLELMVATFGKAVDDVKEREQDKASLIYSRETERVNLSLLRLTMPGGWLVLAENSTSICFVPDPERKWKLKDAPKIRDEDLPF